MGFCSCTVKYLMIIFNLACGIAGLAILIVGIMANYHGGSFKELLSGQVTTVSICLMVLGSVVFLISFFGCCGALREDTCMIQTYGVILLTIIFVEIAIGITAFVYKSKVEDELRNKFGKYFSHYNKNQKVINDIQTSLSCCGYDGPSFWTLKDIPIPDSCCALQSACNIDNSFEQGCYQAVKDYAKSILGVIGGVAIGIGAVELLGVICAFYVANYIKKTEMRGY